MQLDIKNNNYSQETISDRVLLTFSNLANLEWQFANLIKTSKKQKDGTFIDNYPTIKSLLSPENFARKNDYGEIESYTYMPKVKDLLNPTREDKEKGLQEMQKLAGITMEYSENRIEGKFLNDWEIVYGADSYKVISEYLDRINKITGMSIDYPSREQVEKDKVINFILSLGINTLDFTLDIFGGIGASMPNKSEVIKTIGSEVFDKVSDEDNCSILKYGKLVTGNVKSLKKVTNIREIGEFKEDGLNDLKLAFDKGQRESELNEILNSRKVILTQKIDFLSDNKFKVVIFKNEAEKKVVIAYNDKVKDKNNKLPENIDLMQMVIDANSQLFKNYDVTFTAYNEGIDIGLVSYLLTDKSKANFFYNKNIRGVNEYIDFDMRDLDKKYKSTFEVAIENTKGGLKSLSLGAIGVIFSTAVFTGFLALMAIGMIVKLIYDISKSFFYERNLNKQENWFRERKWLEGDEKNRYKDKINGYITDSFYKKESIKLDKENIHIKKSHLLFIIFNKKNDFTLIPDYEVYPDKYMKYRTNKDKIEYLIKKQSYAEENQSSNEFTYNSTDKTSELVNVYWRISSSDKEYYEIKDMYISENKQALYVPFNSITEEDELSIKKMDFIANSMDIIASLQRNWLDNSKNNNITYHYPHDDEIISSKESKNNIQLKYHKASEHIFMPYISENGEFTSNIRLEYINAVYKSAIKSKVLGNEFDFQNKDINIKFNEILFMSLSPEKSQYGYQEINSQDKFYFSNKVSEYIKNHSDYPKKLYSLKRIAIDKGIVHFNRTSENTMHYSYNLNSNITKDEFEFITRNLNNKSQISLVGSFVSLDNTSNPTYNESPEEKIYSFQLDEQENKKYPESRGRGDLVIEKHKIGENLILSTEESSWFKNQILLEEYIESIVIDEKDKKSFNIKYIYDIKNRLLMIRYGYDELYDNEIKIENFRNGDYNIDLPRYHKLNGTLGAKYEDSVKYNFIENNKQISDLRNKNGGDRITTVIDNKNIVLGKNIEIIDNIETKEDNIYRYKQISDEGLLDISDEVYYNYHINDNILEILYGKLYDNTPLFGNCIKVYNFKNGDFGINLSSNFSILYGNVYNTSNNSEIYKFGSELSHSIYSNSCGNDKIMIFNRFLSDEKIKNFTKKSIIPDNFKEIIQDIFSNGYKKLIYSYFGSFGNLYIYDSLYHTLDIIYPVSKANTSISLFNKTHYFYNYQRIMIKDFKNEDYGIKLPNKITAIAGSKYREVYSIKNAEETLPQIALQKLGDSTLWRKLNNSRGEEFTDKEAKRLRVGDKIYIPANI